MAELTGETLKQQVQLEKDNLDASYEHTLRLLNAGWFDLLNFSSFTCINTLFI